MTLQNRLVSIDHESKHNPAIAGGIVQGLCSLSVAGLRKVQVFIVSTDAKQDVPFYAPVVRKIAWRVFHHSNPDRVDLVSEKPGTPVGHARRDPMFSFLDFAHAVMPNTEVGISMNSSPICKHEPIL